MVLAFMACFSAFKLIHNHRGYQAEEKVFHAHYTAGLIEDEIRRIRNEDYQYRKKYDELKEEYSG